MQKLEWTLKDLIKLSLSSIFLGILSVEILIRLMPEATALSFYAIQTVALLLPLFWWGVQKYHYRWSVFGFKKIPLKTLLKNVAQGFLLYYIISTIFLQIMLSYEQDIPGFGEQESHVELFGSSPIEMALGVLIIVGIAPLIEEIFFRGYLYQILKKNMRVPMATVLSAAIFAGSHFEFQVMIPLFILGVILNRLFEKSGSLWTPLVFHMGNNALAFSLELARYYEWIEWPV